MDQERADYADPDPSPRRTAALRDFVILMVVLVFCGWLVFLWHLILR